jgi:hypothetical protein
MKDCRSHFWLLYSQFVFSFRFGSRFLVPGLGSSPSPVGASVNLNTNREERNQKGEQHVPRSN